MRAVIVTMLRNRFKSTCRLLSIGTPRLPAMPFRPAPHQTEAGAACAVSVEERYEPRYSLSAKMRGERDQGRHWWVYRRMSVSEGASPKSALYSPASLPNCQKVLLDETDEGETALHWAVSRQHTAILTMLLNAGANPNVPDNDGYTPLHDLAEMGDCPKARTMLEALLAAGADPSRQEKNGQTPSELAESMGYAMPSLQTTLPQSRAADDFAMIRARIRELRRDE
jgi:ankyrin repeat protein